MREHRARRKSGSYWLGHTVPSVLFPVLGLRDGMRDRVRRHHLFTIRANGRRTDLARNRTFGSVTAVDDLSLSVPQGSIYGFIGPNGSGKTPRLRMIVNIFYPDRGEIRSSEMAGRKTARTSSGTFPKSAAFTRE